MATGSDVQRPAGGFLRTARFRQVIFASIMTLAGATGIVLVTVPGSTAGFFSWGLAPAALASLIGGLYVGSASTFGVAMVRIHVAGRALCLMSIVFTLPTLIITLVHLDVFDFGRWQAWLWLLLFAGAPAFFAAMLWLGAWRSVGSGPRAARWARALLLLIATGATVAAVLLWADPVSAGGWLPFEPPPLGGRFLGVWFAVVAFLSAWSAVRPREEARVTVTAASLLLGGALIAGVRSFSDLGSAHRIAYLAAITAALAVLVATLLTGLAKPRV